MGLSTQQARNAYPELVVGGVTSAWVVIGDRPKCDWSSTVIVPFVAGPPDYPTGGTVKLRFHPSCAEWARACAAVLAAHGYTFNEKVGGSVACRRLSGGGRTSGHAHGFAFDINPSTNRYRRSVGLIQWGRQTDMPKILIRDLEAIRTIDGYKMTQWGGHWTNIKDPMHFQATKCTRSQLEAGIDWTTVNGTPPTEGDDMAAMQVVDFQKALNDAGRTDSSGNRLKEDDINGPKTHSALVKALSEDDNPQIDTSMFVRKGQPVVIKSTT